MDIEKEIEKVNTSIFKIEEFLRKNNNINSPEKNDVIRNFLYQSRIQLANAINTNRSNWE